MLNSIINDDCLNVLRSLPDNYVNLIYLDPPFYTQKKQKLTDRDNNEYHYDDIWASKEEYLDFIEERLIEMKRVLKQNGTIFLHCDRYASHNLRVLLDEVFGGNNFQSEIIWTYKRWSNSKKGLLNSHQTIYFYSKSNDFTFNQLFQDYSATTNIDQIMQDRQRVNGKTKYKLDSNGEIVKSKSKKGVPLSDVWDIPFLNPKAKERTGYPTQKPINLLERIIQIASNTNDIVLDPFCGSGTTAVTAKLMDRYYIGIDSSQDAVKITKERLEHPIKSNSNLLKSGIKQYSNKSEKESQILNLIQAKPVQRNKAVDGFINHHDLGMLPVKIQKDDETTDFIISKMRKSTKTKDAAKKIIIRTKRESTLFNINDGNYDDFILIDDVTLKLNKLLK
ncbi:DNA-methyltransferase [Staphylococcus equorum]|uniref:DNA-methyltransferase n=1 Tax=Staphylococcus equorum TaxID=246432 RepID=UPI000AD12B5C|nr:DNA methyltransferase [Staphylococcus equorum]